MKCQINLDIYNPEAPAFWPAAPLRRTSVFAASENLGAGRIGTVKNYAQIGLQTLAG